MKITVFNGSPSGQNSNTNVIAEAFIKGAKKAGAETENIFLSNENIGHCKGCFSCWFKTPGKCILSDDMDKLLEKYLTSDIVVFATPVYSWTMTAMLKNFVDRLIPLKSPIITTTNGKFDLENSQSKIQKFVTISNCGFPGDKNFEILKASLSPCEPVLQIYRNCGKLLKSKDANIQKVVAEYLEVVEEAGYEMVARGEVCEKTKNGLNVELMPIGDYVKYLGM